MNEVILEYRRKLDSLTPEKKRIWELAHTMMNEMVRSEDAGGRDQWKICERHHKASKAAEDELLELLAAPSPAQGTPPPEIACGLLDGMNEPFVGGCGKEVLPKEAYRCSDCTAVFHRKCINEHFELDAYVKALRDERYQRPLKDWKEAHVKEKLRADIAERERDEARALAGPQNGWVKMPQDRKTLPPESTMVLIYSPKYSDTILQCRMQDLKNGQFKYATHYHALPAPPTGERRKGLNDGIL
jgi:hypothetical protein